MPSTSSLSKESDIQQWIETLSQSILHKNPQLDQVAFIGLPKRGYPLALRLAALLFKKTGITIPVGQIDITFHRDDLDRHTPLPHLTQIPFDTTQRIIILVDDVLFTGRTTRAALSALMDFGRPARIELLTLIDRGHRQMPIQADYVGHCVTTEFTDRVSVHLQEIDNEDVVLLQKP